MEVSSTTKSETVIRQLGKYNILRLLKPGDVTEVFEAIEDGFDERVAIKVLKQNQAKTPVVVKRFRREAMTAASLHHPNIVPLFDIGNVNDTHFYVMQKIRGMNLSEIRDQLRSAQSTDLEFVKRFKDSDFVVGIVCQILDALKYAHSQGVIHRDIKPTNIMVDFDGKAWISDFGTAKLVEGIAENLTTTGCNLGSFRYASPELICANEQECGPVDLRSDLYSLGAVIFEFFTGMVPVSIFDESKYKTFSSFPSTLDATIRQACAQSASERFATAEQFSVALKSHADRKVEASSLIGNIWNRING